MGFAADAISDLIAPPPRPTQPAEAGPSFDDQLDQARAQDEGQESERGNGRADTRARAQDRVQGRADERALANARAERADRACADDPQLQSTGTNTFEAAEAAPLSQVQSETPPAEKPVAASLLQIFASLAAAASEETAPEDMTPEPNAAAAQPQETGAPKLQVPPKAHAKLLTVPVKAEAQDASEEAVTSPAAPSSDPPKLEVSATLVTVAARIEPETESAPSADPAPLAAPEAASLLIPLATQNAAPPAPRPEPPRGQAIEADAAPKEPKAAPEPKSAPARESPGDKPQSAKIAADALQDAKDTFAALARAAASDAPSQPVVPAHASGAQSASRASDAGPDAAAATRAVPVAAQMGREIIHRANGGATRFEMRLDPPELGRVDVRLEVTRDHRVTAVIYADNPQALSELSRGARDLQQALQSAGLELSDDGLSFDLSNHQNAFNQSEYPDGRAPSSSRAAPAAPEAVSPARALSLESWRGTRVDLVA